MRSYPKYVTLGTHYACNARCVFCLGGDYPAFDLEKYRNFFEPRLREVLESAQHVGFCGYGETLMMPGIEEFLDYINGTLPAPRKLFTTNGTTLGDSTVHKLMEGRYGVIISLHAADPGLHMSLTGIRAYERIIGNIRNMIELKRKNSADLHMNLVFLATTMNIGTLPEFVRLGAELGADRISCSYLTIFSPEHIKMSCFFQQEKTAENMIRAAELAAELGLDIALPPLFNKRYETYETCNDPWEFFYAETQGSVLPCCYAGDHIGYLNDSDFMGIWNGSGYRKLREGLIGSEPHLWCRNCYKYDPNKVNSFSSHVTFRQETQKKIMETYERDFKKENR